MAEIETNMLKQNRIQPRAENVTCTAFSVICNQEVIHLFTERGCQLSLRNSTFRKILVEFHVPRSLCVLGDMEVAVMIFIRVVSESRFL